MISLLCFGSSRLRQRPRAQSWLGLGVGVFFGLLSFRMAGADGTQPEAPLKYEEPKSLTAAIYERGSQPQRLLFRFKRQATRSGSTIRVVRDFTYPDGKVGAREEAVYEGNSLVSFVLRELQTGAVGSAKIRRSSGQTEGTILFEYAKNPDSAARTRSEPLRDDPLIGDMVGPFLAEHWEALMRGEKAKCRYIVVSRMETVGFSFVKAAGTAGRNSGAVSIKMEPTSRIIAAIVAPLYFSMEKAPPHRVLQYNGRTAPKLNVRGKWEDLDAVTVFDWK